MKTKLCKVLSLRWHLSGLKILLATLNTLSTGAKVAGTTKYCIASLESVGIEALFCSQNLIGFVFSGRQGSAR